MAYQWCRVVNDVLHTKRRKELQKGASANDFRGFFSRLRIDFRLLKTLKSPVKVFTGDFFSCRTRCLSY